MGEIYSIATAALAWLGPRDNHAWVALADMYGARRINSHYLKSRPEEQEMSLLAALKQDFDAKHLKVLCKNS